MRRTFTRTLGVITTLAVVGLTFEVIGGGAPIASAGTAVPMVCDGDPNFQTGIGSSAFLVSLLKPALGLSVFEIPLDVTVQAPAEVDKGSAPFEVRVGVGVSLDPKFNSEAQKFLGKSTVKIENASFVFEAVNGGTNIAGSVPDQVIDLNAAPPGPQFISGMVNPSGGRIGIVPKTAALDIAINATIAGAGSIGTLRIICTAKSDEPVASIAVRVPGAPRVADIVVDGRSGLSAADLRTNGWIQPDQGNPVLFDTLKITGPTHGAITGTLGPIVGLIGAPVGGTFRVPMQVCAGSLLVKGEPGVAEEAEVIFGGSPYGGDLNPLPLGFTMKVGDQETPVFRTSVNAAWQGPFFEGLTGPQYMDLSGPNWLYHTNYRFVPPSAAEVQAALEALPNVGKGNVAVTTVAGEGINAGYRIKFVGALAEGNQPEVTVGQFWANGPPDEYNKLLAQVTQLAGSGGGASAPPVTQEQLFGYILAGNFDAFSAAVSAMIVGAIVGGIAPEIPGILATLDRLFPDRPSAKTVVGGKATIADSQTGALCTQFDVRFRVPPSPNVVGQPPGQPPKVCTKKVRQRVRVKVRGKTRIRYRTVTKKVACPKPKAKVVKKKVAKKKVTKKKVAVRRTSARRR